ncbi:hypothetical protein HCN44_002588 [Aphidius gifuensis]|uniref:N-terminal acetyltransferase B complex subunit MDM20 homolog n=1 Tax=Aphidius gifuensis TaxID=684658 RepID=A0A834Y3C8_APHGI|nr:N-alpha-acetyltransferase 25, NatB auxiliary subunit [Aphidius gifuensis]KAF7996942.1 hypothetical protein HCN44_002588 [Aphidius gifuensis]
MMASKAHVDNTVNERRLRPIYEWLDNGNNKKALQEADKVLKKQPTNQCARVLKALALLRLGKEDDCQLIMDKVRSEIPCEDATLQAMSICYKEIHQPEKIREVYEAAAKADPTNEELLTHLFMSYVRLGDYKKQQQTAMSLYKLSSKNPYYFWAVMSIVMQAIEADDKLSKNIILPLAERMVLKLVNENKLEAEQEVQLYIMILERQGKDNDILNVLSGKLADKLSGIDEKKAMLYLKLKKYDIAEMSYKKLIIDDPDNWTYYLNYLTSSLNINKPIDCLEFLQKISDKCGKKYRGPQLGIFELIKRTNNIELLNNIDIIKLMRKYFNQFGNKGCVVGDLRLYLNLLTDNDKLLLINNIKLDVGLGDYDDLPTTTDQLLRHIHLEEIKRICGMHHSPIIDTKQRNIIVKHLCNYYEAGSKLCPSDERLVTDFAPFDSYITIVSHLLIQMWYDTNDAKYLYQTMVLLERALYTSPANFHLKIMLVRAYHEAGLIVAANCAYSFLDVKQIQLDSLGYLHAPLLAPMGHLSGAAVVLDQTVKFSVANYKHSADRLTFAYKYGSFVKIQEFVELRDRLENSIHFSTSTVDKMLLELSWCDNPKNFMATLNPMRVQPHEDSIKWDALRDNRDLEVVAGWEPLSDSNDPRRYDDTRACMIQILAARNSILRIIAASVEEKSSTLLAKLSSELNIINNERIPKCIDKFMTNDKKIRVESILVPLDAVERVREAYESEQLSIIARLADSISQFSKPDSDCIEAIRISKSLIPLPIPESDGPVSYKDFFLRASTCGETLAFLGLICVASISKSHPEVNNRRNRKKNNRDISSLTPDDTQSWTEMGNLLTEKIQKLETILNDLQSRPLITGLDSDVYHATQVVCGRARDSIERCCCTLKARLQLTAKLINNLRS